METKTNADRLMIVRLGIHQWYPRKYDAKATRTIADIHGVSAERAGRFNKILVDLGAIKPLQQKLRQLREDHYAMTCPWGDNGSRVLPAELFFDYTQMISDAVIDIDRLADDYAEQYEAERDKAKRDLNGLFNESDYPDRHELRARFGVDYKFEPLPDSGGVNKWTALDDKARENIREELQTSMDKAVLDAHSHVINQVVERANEFIDNLRKHETELKATDKSGRIQESWVANLRDIIDLVLRGLNITGDQQLVKLAADLNASLSGVTADRLRHGSSLRIDKANEVEKVLEKFQGVYG